MIFSCYKLNENKIMSDGPEIRNDVNLFCIIINQVSYNTNG